MEQNGQQKRKVLFVVTKGTWGGAQRYVFDLARSLANTEYEPVVAFGDSGRLSQELEKLQIKTHSLGALVRDVIPIADFLGFFEMLECIRSEKPEVVHLNSSKAGVLGVLAARLARVPRIIFTVHGWPFKEKRGFISRNIFYAFSWLTAYLSDAVIVVSKIDEEMGRKMPGIAEKIHYIPIGIGTPEYLSKEQALQELQKMVPPERCTPESIRIVTIAELTANKGVQYGLDAMIHLRRDTSDNFVYIVMGEGEERKSLESFVKIHRLDDKVFFVGFVENACLYLRAFDAFLLPSIKEGMPYVLLEAGESGIPIVATDVVNPEIKERYENVRLVRPGNGFAIADGLRKVRDGKHDSAAPLRNAPRFPLGTMVQQTLELYARK